MASDTDEKEDTIATEDIKLEGAQEVDPNAMAAAQEGAAEREAAYRAVLVSARDWVPVQLDGADGGSATAPTSTPAHIPGALDVQVDSTTITRWKERRGGELERMIATGAVALLDAKWVIRLARQDGRFKPRQALPDEAFLSLTQVQAATAGLELPVVCVSHPWLQPEHPDPHGHNLQTLARALEALLEDELLCNGTAGVFYDFSSMHQKCRRANGSAGDEIIGFDPSLRGGVGRYASEQALFTQALHDVSVLFSHPHTHVWKLTELPPDYDHELQYKQSGNRAPYEERGWCFCEQLLAEMMKSGYLVLDLGKIGSWVNFWDMQSVCSDVRRAPMLPSRVAAELQNKSFTNGRDRPIVARIYAEGFAKRWGEVEEIDYSYLDWGDMEARLLGDVLRKIRAPNLKKISLSLNSIGPEGTVALAEGVKGLKGLQALVLDRNEIGAEGAIGFAKRMKNMKALQYLNLDGNEIGPEGALALTRAIKGLRELELLNLVANQIDDEAKRMLKERLPAGLEMKV
eukprot:scaffold14213_cov26-Tisochrysis_lutea.AAC.1